MDEIGVSGGERNCRGIAMRWQYGTVLKEGADDGAGGRDPSRKSGEAKNVGFDDAGRGYQVAVLSV